MYKTLAPGCIGHNLSFKEAARPAAKYGFEGYWLGIEEVAKMPVSETKEILEKNKLRAAGFSLPVEYRKDKNTYMEGMEKLEFYAEYANSIGANRCVTWIFPFSDTLSYADNFELHRSRLGKAAEILKKYDILLGMEFLGPPKLRKNVKYEFIHNLDQMLELCDAIGTGNCGILLDVWHWDMAGHNIEDFKKFTNPDQVVLVHINDAPEGIPVEEQEDLIRRLPGSTGVLKIKDFFTGLISLGYKGPVLAEPFEKSLSSVSFDEALKITMDSINKVWPKNT